MGNCELTIGVLKSTSISPKGTEEEQDLSTGSGSWQQREQGIEIVLIRWDRLKILLED